MQVFKRCNLSGCRELIETTDTYCEKHKGVVNREYNQFRKETNKEYVDFYRSYRWQQTRKKALQRHQYLCVYCLKDDIYTIADEVHHEIPTKTKEGWKKRFDIDTLSPICRPCHNRIEKTKRF